ncbi:MAG: hypothetical protein ABJL54_16130 [Halioglobus sp.]
MTERRSQSNSLDLAVSAARGDVMSYDWPAHIPRMPADNDNEQAITIFKGVLELRTNWNVAELDVAASLSVILVEKGKLLGQLMKSGFFVRRNTDFGANVGKSPVWEMYSAASGEAIRLSNRLRLFRSEDTRSERKLSKAGMGAKFAIHADAGDSPAVDWVQLANQMGDD